MKTMTLEELKHSLEQAQSNYELWGRTVRDLRDAIAQLVAEFKVGDIVAQTREVRGYRSRKATTIYRITRVLPEDSWEDDSIIARYVGRRIRKDGTDGVEESTIADYNGPIRRALPEEIPGHNAAVTPEKQ